MSGIACDESAPGEGHRDPALRLVSLDALRGAAIALMILVNSPGDPANAYSLLRHADWNGWTLADTIFPTFLFLVGVSIVFSLDKQREKTVSDPALVGRILKRTLILFMLGIFVNIFPRFDLSTLRIPGVLQRIAVCYFFVSLIVLKTGLKGRILWLSGLLASYWLMMRFIPVPGIGAGVIEPGKNFAAWVDSHLLSGYMWSYYGGKWDPEGIVSTLPALATTLFGVLSGQWLKSYLPGGKKTAAMLLAGALMMLAGLVLGHWLPINKSIWTSTFSIFMAGLAVIFLALFYWFIDVAGFVRWAKPLSILGMNAITLYILSIVYVHSLWALDVEASAGKKISAHAYLFGYFSTRLGPEADSLLWAIWIVFSMYLVAWIMWRKRIFIKI
ncbi:MAG: heparan-alpha-glucosaminide N-acetyltransferase domain-containing protein [Syntrophobacteraceae bacterium]|nr:heparan-alpha-glucosaminide N-acetyltransferase domain-containing protein [Syntrophobacteraceae bacterium]